MNTNHPNRLHSLIFTTRLIHPVIINCLTIKSKHKAANNQACPSSQIESCHPLHQIESSNHRMGNKPPPQNVPILIPINHYKMLLCVNFKYAKEHVLWLCCYEGLFIIAANFVQWRSILLRCGVISKVRCTLSPICLLPSRSLVPLMPHSPPKIQYMKN